MEIADRYKDLPLQAKIDVIAQAFGCKTGEIHTSPCTGKWRGTSDMTIRFDNGASLFIGNNLTPKAKTVKVQTECVNRTLVQYNPEIVKATKEAALPALLQREAKDNEIAAQKGLKPYTLLNVEFNEGADEKTGGYIGWYYVTLAVDGKICTHLETGLNHDIADGKVSDTPSRGRLLPGRSLERGRCGLTFLITWAFPLRPPSIWCRCGTMCGNGPKRHWPSAAPPRRRLAGMGLLHHPRSENMGHQCRTADPD